MLIVFVNWSCIIFSQNKGRTDMEASWEMDRLYHRRDRCDRMANSLRRATVETDGVRRNALVGGVIKELEGLSRALDMRINIIPQDNVPKRAGKDASGPESTTSSASGRDF